MIDHQQPKPKPKPKRILLLSLEFNYSPFSGNGVLARSLVSGLIRHQDNSIVRVICARPHPSTPGLSKDAAICHSSTGNSSNTGDDTDDCNGGSNMTVWPVDLPLQCQWKRLDRSGPWEEYATACSTGDLFATRVKKFRPTHVIAVDWHGMLAWESIRRHHDVMMSHCENGMEDEPPTSTEDGGVGLCCWHPSNVPVCYYNFRVFSSSSWGVGHNNNSSAEDGTERRENKDDPSFYREKEQLSCRLADVIICLSEHDNCMIRRLIEDDVDSQQHQQTGKPSGRKVKNIHVLYPPLRGDIWELASKNSKEGCFNLHLPPEAKRAIESASASSSTSRCKQRLFLTCVVRLSPEKTPHHFITLLKRLGGVDFLRSNSLIPVVCGARSVEGYAKKVMDDFREMMRSSSSEGDDDNAWPCVVIDRHLGPTELAAVFSRTAVNVHPCMYDAYGMTLVESAAFGAPSIVNNGGKIGAVSLLGEGKGCMAVDLEQVFDEVNDDGNCRNGIVDAILALSLLVGNLQKLESSENCVMLREIAEEARSKALHWNEMACCQGLTDILNGLEMG